MRGLTVKGDRMAFHPEGAQHRAQGKIEIQQHRALFNVQFQIRGGVFQFHPAVLHPFQIHAHGLQGGRQSDAIAILEPARLVQIQIARAGRGTEETLAKSRAFFVRPIHEANGDWRLAVVLRMDAP